MQNENNLFLRSAWKVSKYLAISGPYFPAFGLNTETPYLDTFHAVLENRKSEEFSVR